MTVGLVNALITKERIAFCPRIDCMAVPTCSIATGACVVLASIAFKKSMQQRMCNYCYYFCVNRWKDFCSRFHCSDLFFCSFLLTLFIFCICVGKCMLVNFYCYMWLCCGLLICFACVLLSKFVCCNVFYAVFEQWRRSNNLQPE